MGGRCKRIQIWDIPKGSDGFFGTTAKEQKY
jgi:hypothetical protein